MRRTRRERDSLGEIEVPADRLWGAQTQRSLENFRISRESMPGEIIEALAWIKRACATVNESLGGLTGEKARSISRAADEVLEVLGLTKIPIDTREPDIGNFVQFLQRIHHQFADLLAGDVAVA